MGPIVYAMSSGESYVFDVGAERGGGGGGGIYSRKYGKKATKHRLQPKQVNLLVKPFWTNTIDNA